MTAATYRPGTRTNRDFISADLAAQLREKTIAFETRVHQLGQAICEYIDVDEYFAWVDSLPDQCDTDDDAMLDALEAKLAEVRDAAYVADPQGDHDLDWMG